MRLWTRFDRRITTRWDWGDLIIVYCLLLASPWEPWEHRCNITLAIFIQTQFILCLISIDESKHWNFVLTLGKIGTASLQIPIKIVMIHLNQIISFIGWIVNYYFTLQYIWIMCVLAISYQKYVCGTIASYTWNFYNKHDTTEAKKCGCHQIENAIKRTIDTY